MSKLDDIFDTFNNDDAVEIHLTDSGKQAIKNLILELIGEYKAVPRPLDEESRARFYRVSGQNFTKGQIRRKVKNL